MQPRPDELAPTYVTRPVALTLTVAFALLIYGVPLSQALREQREGEDSSLSSLFLRNPTADNLRQFETELEQASYAKEFTQPRLQLALSRYGRLGNKRAVIGEPGWLYYTPGLTHLAGPSFIDRDALRRRASESDDVQPDPRPAIFAFQSLLAQRGIVLILFPVPDKAMLQPMQLHQRGARNVSQPVAHNLGWQAFVSELRARGVTVFEPSPAQLSARDAPRFLAQDTHWTPEWMDSVARELATVVNHVAGARRPRRDETALHTVALQVARVGDLVDMLKLPDDQTLFEPQSIVLQQVQDATGALWQPDETAEVLLLGDSFTNVFSQPEMGWGEAAGLAPHLALALGDGHGVDVIAQNDSGAFATRQELARALAAGTDRLQGKRVVVWELAARELSVGNWKELDWEPPTAAVTSEEHVDVTP